MLKNQATIIEVNAGSGALTSTQVRPPRYSLRIRPTAQNVDGPAAIARHVAALQSELDALANATATPFGGSVLVKGLAFTGGTARYVAHQLGRAPQGWLCTRAQTAAWSGYELALETGHDATKEIRLQTATTGTFDILFF